MEIKRQRWEKGFEETITQQWDNEPKKIYGDYGRQVSPYFKVIKLEWLV